ncbi:hypothetical protein Tsubulata_022296 [Turnera subulata]|uniref:Nuclear transcription factor Y subunit n=1 Tax=Turnera subulata TaxID=218843 RepID=A0A9Q0J856_9ROSI|nr:hypothetical protein Tsubulata_022296 [Turnera subulata]
MALKTLYLKEHEGVVQNPTVPWWSAFASQSVNAVSCEGGGPVSATKQATGLAHHQLLSKGSPTPFTLIPGQYKPSGDGEKPQVAISLQPEYHPHFDLGFGQAMICAKYPLVDQCYGVLTTCGPPISGRMMLPMTMATDDGPIYVNAKQYHGIMRRRKSRAKAVIENKLTRNRKPYMHYSRHLHAMRRPRGCGGRFLNTKEQDNPKGKLEGNGGADSQHTGSQSSEVLQSSSGSGSMNSPKGASGGGSYLSGSEVTSMFSRGDINGFPFHHLSRPPIHSFPQMMETGHGINAIPTKWVAGCNLKI